MAVLRLLRGFLGWEDFQKGLQVNEFSVIFYTISNLIN